MAARECTRYGFQLAKLERLISGLSNPLLSELNIAAFPMNPMNI